MPPDFINSPPTGYIDKTGKMIISPQFSDTSGFADGLAAVKVGKKLGYIDHAGNYVWAPRD